MDNLKREQLKELLKLNDNHQLYIKGLAVQHEKEIEKAVQQIKEKKNEIEQYIHEDLVQYEQNSLYWQKA